MLFDYGVTCSLFYSAFMRKSSLKLEFLYPLLSVSTHFGHLMNIDWVCKGYKVTLDREDWQFGANLIIMPTIF